MLLYPVWFGGFCVFVWLTAAITDVNVKGATACEDKTIIRHTARACNGFRADDGDEPDGVCLYGGGLSSV